MADQDIRRATADDIPHLVGMGGQFHAAKQGKYEFRADDCARFFAGLIGNPAAVVFVAPDGFICGAASPAPTNSAYVTAYELFWWSQGRSGIRLRKMFERWAAESGCSEVVFSHPENEAAVGKMLLRAGYAPETRVLRKAV